MVNPNANELTVDSYFEYACPADDLARTTAKATWKLPDVKLSQRRKMDQPPKLLLLCSLFRLKEPFDVKNDLTM